MDENFRTETSDFNRSDQPFSEHEFKNRCVKRLTRFFQNAIALRASIERFAVRNPLRYSFLSIAILFALVLSFISPFYETNDDAVMSMIASGTGIGARPDEHLVFTNFLIGFVLKFLYTIAPQISWYGVYLVFVHYLANVAATYSVLSWRYRRTIGNCFILLIATVGTQLLIRLQFTSTAMWATSCGIFTILTSLCRRRDDARQRVAGMLCTGAGLVSLGAMVRFEPFLIATLAAGIPCLFLVWELNWKTDRTVRTWRIGLITAVATIFIIAVLQISNNAYYDRDVGWREFFAFNPYRVKFNDYQWTNFTERTKPVFDRVQWTENDYELISKHWYFDDDQVFSRENLQLIVDGYPWASSVANWRNFGVWWLILLKDRHLWAIWFQIPLYLWFSRNPKATFIHLVIAAVAIDTVMCGMLLKAPVFRMYFPLFAMQALFSLLYMRCGVPALEKWNKNVPFRTGFWFGLASRFKRGAMNFELKTIWLERTFVVIALFGAGISLFQANKLSRRVVASNRRLLAEIAKINPQDDQLYVCWGGCFPYESILPLDSPQKLKNFHLLCLGWTQKTPVNLAVKNRFQIRDLAVDLVDRKNVFLISSEYLNPYFEKFILEHYDRSVDWKKCFSSSTFDVWKPVSETFDQARATSRNSTASHSTKQVTMASESVADDELAPRIIPASSEEYGDQPEPINHSSIDERNR